MEMKCEMTDIPITDGHTDGQMDSHKEGKDR